MVEYSEPVSPLHPEHKNVRQVPPELAAKVARLLTFGMPEKPKPIVDQETLVQQEIALKILIPELVNSTPQEEAVVTEVQDSQGRPFTKTETRYIPTSINDRKASVEKFRSAYHVLSKLGENKDVRMLNFVIRDLSNKDSYNSESMYNAFTQLSKKDQLRIAGGPASLEAILPPSPVTEPELDQKDPKLRTGLLQQARQRLQQFRQKRSPVTVEQPRSRFMVFVPDRTTRLGYVPPEKQARMDRLGRVLGNNDFTLNSFRDAVLDLKAEKTMKALQDLDFDDYNAVSKEYTVQNNSTVDTFLQDQTIKPLIENGTFRKTAQGVTLSAVDAIAVGRDIGLEFSDWPMPEYPDKPARSVTNDI